MVDEIKEGLPPLDKQEFREKLTVFLEATNRAEEAILGFQKKQEREKGQGVFLGALSADEREEFLTLNNRLSESLHHVHSFTKKITDRVLSEEPFVRELTHDLTRPEIAYFAAIDEIVVRLDMGESREEEFQRRTIEMTPWTDSALIRHTKRVLRSFSGEILGKPKKEEFNIVEIINDVAIILRANSKVGLFEDLPKNAIEINFKSNKEIMINGREDDLYRVFYNILRNSEKILGRNFKDTKQKGMIDIEIKDDEERQQVIVNLEDNGPGIDAEAVLSSAIKAGVTTRREGEKMTEEEKLQLIFLPGVTGFAEIGIRDTGKGLSICKRIVGEHEGTIKIQSKTGVGTTFIINLPK